MPDFTKVRTSSLSTPKTSSLEECSPLELAQTLAEKLALTDENWHRLKSNRQVRASEQVAAALVFLLKNQSEESLMRLRQACGWLEGSISAPPCPSHGHNSNPGAH